MDEARIRDAHAAAQQDASRGVKGGGDPALGAEVDRHGTSSSVLDAKSVAVLIGLVLLADFLFWEHSLGVSLIIYSAALSGAAYLNLRPVMKRQELTILAVIWVACALPVLEYVQLASLSFLSAGHFGVLIWMATRSPLAGIARNLARLSYIVPEFLWSSWPSIGRSVAARQHFKIQREALSGWIVPIGVGGVFLLLFLLANPVLENWADRLFDMDLSQNTLRRVAFGIVVAVVVLPFAVFRHFAKAFSDSEFHLESQLDVEGHLLNAKSITNSLLVFNVMFLFQNATDIAFLWGGSALPDGMNYATYAHKGAYPLMATSVLAGVFAVMSRRYLKASAMLKGLLAVWIAQNIFLVGSALTRLDLYVDAYGLTFLRMRAGIGMALVLVGMVLLIWQLWRSKSNAWVTNVFAAVTVLTLYICCFVNFGYVIAKSNVAHPERRLDIRYLCDETPGGIAVVLAESKRRGLKLCSFYYSNRSVQIEDWRSWSFRQARLDDVTREYKQFATPNASAPADDTASRNRYDYN
ncbi:uncharacterized protein DUF4173 [Litoreibacter meonggei]|uniref:Uncharacterized protein DUF4173 n=1 Tax=Litoreibacter meonggei TaxID=1049199 RepID=A0A497X3G5_9RHOB|nr:DUF4173 domain-containing protein [Litoreibacter meonggei]RLJ59549.1 uncharacterized protein DUF4173 [Litoreibacter meonggei]